MCCRGQTKQNTSNALIIFELIKQFFQNANCRILLSKVNRSNENVISWLNKQLASFKSTQTALGPSIRGGASGRGGKTRGGGLTRKSTSDVNEATKEK